MSEGQEQQQSPKEIISTSYPKESFNDDGGGLSRIKAALTLGVGFQIYPAGATSDKGETIPEGRVGMRFEFHNRDQLSRWTELARNWSTQGEENIFGQEE